MNYRNELVSIFLINIKILCMGKLTLKLKKYFFDYNYFLFLILTLFITFQINNFYYISTESPDFYHLKNYISFYFGDADYTDRDMGLAYFNIISLVIKQSSSLLTDINQNHLIHNAILTTNYLLYTFGLLGFYKLLILKKFNKKDILFAFIVVSIFPQTINMLLTMKPEIFAFSLITWSFYFIENYLSTKNILNMYLLTMPFSLLISTKGSIFFFCGMIFLYIFIKNYKNFLNVKLIPPYVIGILFFLFLMIENIESNNYSIFQHVSSSNDGSYEYTASLQFLYNINFYHLVTQPFSNFHADSLIGIILLDTFGDYFNFWAYNDESIFVVNNLSIKPIWFITHYAQMSSIFLTLLFYFSIIYFTKKDNKNRIYYLSPLFAILLLIINSFGFPIRNYNPETSDTFKTHYYSFLLVISFVFIVLNLVKKHFFNKVLIFIVIFSSTLYLYGFPKNYNSNLNEYFDSKNSVSVFCSFNSRFVSSFNGKNCKNITYQTCSISRIINNTNNLEDSEENPINYKYFLPISLIDPNGDEVNVRSKQECINKLSLGFLPKQQLQTINRVSWVNLSLSISAIVSSLVFFLYAYRRSKTKT